MSIHLIGGGRDEAQTAALLASFVAESISAAKTVDPVIALLLVLEPEDQTSVDRFTRVLVRAGAPASSIRLHAITEGERFDATAVAGAHGVFVGGGLTPAYLDALVGIAEEIRWRIANGAPYAGFSAGAAVAATRALIGGFLLDGRVVSPEEAAEDLEAVAVRDGLGLVEATLDVHAAQWGTLSRLVAVVDSGLAESGAAIDEHTALVVDGSHSTIMGAGQVWRAERIASSVAVSPQRASAP